MKTIKNLTITHRLMQQVLKIFIMFYNKGVKDAYDIGDDGYCREHIEATTHPLKFGKVGDKVSDTPLYWQLQIMEVARAGKMYNAIYNYFHNMGRYGSNFLSVFLVLVQEFYNKGLRDYCDNPLLDMGAFERKGWKAKIEQGRLVNWQVRDLVITAQEMCFIRSRVDVELDIERKPLKESQYAMYIKVLSLATMERQQWD